MRLRSKNRLKHTLIGYARHPGVEGLCAYVADPVARAHRPRSSKLAALTSGNLESPFVTAFDSKSFLPQLAEVTKPNVKFRGMPSENSD
jgi:hypothetical protein